MTELHTLAAAIGLVRSWWDVAGRQQEVSDDALGAIATALGYPADSAAAIAHSLARVEEERRRPPALLVVDAGRPIQIPSSLARADLVAEDGTGLTLSIEGGSLPAVAEPGYYRLALGSHEVTLAVAPPCCHGLQDIENDRRIWGPSIQIPSLRGPVPQPFGHFGHLDDAVERFAARGADVVMINPVHALFPGCGVGFSPYSPSSRLFLNGAMGDPALIGLPPLPSGDDDDTLIDWETALPQRLAQLRAVFGGLTPEFRSRVINDSLAGGDALRRHAVESRGGRRRKGGTERKRDHQSHRRCHAHVCLLAISPGRLLAATGSSPLDVRPSGGIFKRTDRGKPRRLQAWA